MLHEKLAVKVKRLFPGRDGFHRALEVRLGVCGAPGAVKFESKFEVCAGIIGEAGEEAFGESKGGEVFLRILMSLKGEQVEVGFVW